MMTTHVSTRAPGRGGLDLTKIAFVEQLLPWKVTDLVAQPYRGMIGHFNPSIHFDGDVWRCVIRCADYAMPQGVTVRPDNARPNVVTSKNAIVILDPKTWRVVQTYLVRELDGLPRTEMCSNVGFEDMRIFITDKGGFQGIAASLHLARAATGTRGQVPPEQVIVSFDDRYNIVAADPIRGNWSNGPQKNWIPFDGATEPRFLYSIERGIVFDDQGPLTDMAKGLSPLKDPRPENRGGTEVKMMRAPAVVSAGRAQLAGYSGIRGGSQLVHVGEDEWLGVGHEMRYLQGKKFYWHTFFKVDGSGQLLARSQPMKIAKNGIEFAAGMAIDGDRVVISFGVDDAECKIGETSLEALRAELVPVEEIDPPTRDGASHASEHVTLTEPKRPAPTFSRAARATPEARVAAPAQASSPAARASAFRDGKSTNSTNANGAAPIAAPARYDAGVKVSPVSLVAVSKNPRGNSRDLVGLLRQVRESAMPGAWPPLDKMQGMALLVAALRPELAVEIGVWTGDSLIPQLLAMKFVDKGKAIAIDPWSSKASIENQTAENQKWWGDVDHDVAYATFMRRLDEHGVADRCQVVRAASDMFDPSAFVIDLLHVDGNHGPQAMRDVDRYAPRVRVGGILVLDDVGWQGGYVAEAQKHALDLGFEEIYPLGTGVVMQRRRS